MIVDIPLPSRAEFLSDLRDDSGDKDDKEAPPSREMLVQFKLQQKGTSDVIGKSKHSVWSWRTIEILDTALCLYHVAQTADMTLTLSDIPNYSEHSFSAQTALIQKLLECEFLMMSRYYRHLAGKPWFRIYLYTAEEEPSRPMECWLSTDVRSVNKFARDLRQVYSTIQTIASKLYSWAGNYNRENMRERLLKKRSAPRGRKDGW